MTYTVRVTEQAFEELEAAFAWLVRRTEQHAPAWHGRVLDAINSLEQSPAAAHSRLKMKTLKKTSAT